MALELIPLAEAISALRTQLAEAQRQGRDQEIRFEVGDVEVEFQVVVEREAEAGGKIGFRLFGLGSEATAGGKLADARTQMIKLTLTPKTSGRRIDISARSGPLDPPGRESEATDPEGRG
jgi:hypothetical protein